MTRGDASLALLLTLLSQPRRPALPPTPEQLAQRAKEEERAAWNRKAEERKLRKGKP